MNFGIIGMRLIVSSDNENMYFYYPTVELFYVNYERDKLNH